MEKGNNGEKRKEKNEKEVLMPKNLFARPAVDAVPSKPCSLRLRPSQQLQTLLASSKALSVIRNRAAASRPFPPTPPSLRLRP